MAVSVFLRVGARFLTGFAAGFDGGGGVGVFLLAGKVSGVAVVEPNSGEMVR